MNAQVAISRFVTAAGGGSAAKGAYVVTDTIGESVVGSSHSAVYAVSAGFWGTFGSAPVPSTYTLTAAAGSPTVIPISAVLAGASADGETVLLTGADAVSSHGGAISRDASNLTYTSANGFTGADSFQYVIVDQSGDTAIGTITIEVVAGGLTPAPTITNETVLPNGQFRLQFSGAPNAIYTVLASTNLITWAPIGVAAQISSGQFQFIDTNAANFPRRFYKLETVPSLPAAGPTITSPVVLSNGQFQFQFSGVPNAIYTVLASSNLTTWAPIGVAAQISSGHFQFIDTNAANFPRRFYKVELAASLPAVGPTITSENVLPNGQFHIHFLGDSAAVYTVLASTNLTTWTPVGLAIQTTAGVFDFTDINAASFPHRFYKLQVGVSLPPVNPVTVPVISGAATQTNGFHVHINGATNSVYFVSASTNLQTWIVLGLAIQTSPGSYDFVDTNSFLFPRRFYRVAQAVLAPAAIVALTPTNGGFNLLISGAGSSYTVMTSTNLAQWTPLGSAAPVGANLFQFIDAIKAPARFYRIRSP
ncbi:MAG TPA: cadherin-like domain-containing protein [Verrucomicrobiae bacterium]|nr:cadherin-like domain-containing protein [Verrucomicrobiae bacterium]